MEKPKEKVGTLTIFSTCQCFLQALLKMNFVERLRYTLEVVRPHAPVVIHILQILNRIVRHSVQTAYQVS